MPTFIAQSFAWTRITDSPWYALRLRPNANTEFAATWTANGTRAGEGSIGAVARVELQHMDSSTSSAILSPDQDVLDFFKHVYMLKPKMAGGSEATASDYRTQLNHLNDAFQEANERSMRLADFHESPIYSAMKASIDAGNTRDTANKIFRVALALWNYAHVKLPADISRPPKLERFKTPTREPEAWWFHEFEKLVAAALRLEGNLKIDLETAERLRIDKPIPRSVFAECLLRVLFNSGARISAVMRIERSWIDLPGNKVTILYSVQKDDEDRTVTLLPSTVDAIERLLELAPTITRPFDVWPHDRYSRQWKTLNKLLRDLIVAAGLRDNRESVSRLDLWHKVRRTFATYITIKSDIETAREMLGHSSVEVTKRYIDRSKLGEKSQADLLDDPKPLGLRVVGAG